MRRALGVAMAVSACGCAGASFESGQDPLEIDAARAGNDPSPAQTSTPEAGAAIETGTSGPCGPARDGDAPTFIREVCVAESTFTMGDSGLNLGGSFADHTPPHMVALSTHFLDAYEVTVGRYRACVEA